MGGIAECICTGQAMAATSSEVAGVVWVSVYLDHSSTIHCFSSPP